MTAADIRYKLHEEIDHGDLKLLKMIYAMIKEYRDEDETADIDKRKALIKVEREKYLRGEGKSYSWEEAKKIITGKKPYDI